MKTFIHERQNPSVRTRIQETARFLQFLSLHIPGFLRTQWSLTGSPSSYLAPFFSNFKGGVSFCILTQSDSFCIIDGGFNSLIAIIKISYYFYGLILCFLTFMLSYSHYVLPCEP